MKKKKSVALFGLFLFLGLACSIFALAQSAPPGCEMMAMRDKAGGSTSVLMCPGADGVWRAPGAAEAAPSAGTEGRYVISPGVFVPVPGKYPDKFYPEWAIGHKNGIRVLFDFQTFVARTALSPTSDGSIFLGGEGGRSVLGFQVMNTPWMCIAAIVIPADGVVLGPQPQTFQLANFHISEGDGTQRPCAAMSRHVRQWSGQITLSATPMGDVVANLVLDTFSDNGAHTFRNTAQNVVSKNLMPPELARRKIDAEREQQHIADQRKKELEALVAKATSDQAKFKTNQNSLVLAKDLSEDIIHIDSMFWRSNLYIIGSMRNVNIKKSQDGDVIIHGSYDYIGFGGQAEGWVEVDVKGGEVRCLRYWDLENACRPVGGSTMAYNAINSLADGIVHGSSSSAGGDGAGSRQFDPADEYYRLKNAEESQAANRPRYDPPPPPPPIAPLYSCASPPCM